MTGTAARAGGSGRWLFGPVPDLVLGCGLGYAAFFLAQVLAGDTLRAWLPLALQPFLTLLIGGPHYGATLLRVYQRREDRQRYALFAVWLSALIAALYLVGLSSIWVGSWIVTVYLTWSPWHYSGQNYGVTLMLLRRRGVDVTPLAKRLLYASFLLSFALVFLTLHGVAPGATYAPADTADATYSFQSLGIPFSLAMGLSALAGVGFLACGGGALLLLKRSGSWNDLGPAVVLVAVQALWFVLPSASQLVPSLGGVDPFDPVHAPYTFMWVAMGHFVQYLWITTYYAERTGHERGHARFLAKTLVAGAALWTVPVFLFSPALLGGLGVFHSLPWDMGLGLLTAASVNIHHFMLDGAIWKLRDGRISRVLLRRVEAATELERAAPPIQPAPTWRAPLLWGTGVVVLALALFVRFAGQRFQGGIDERDVVAMIRSSDRLRALGRGSPKYDVAIAQMLVTQDRADEALRYVERSLDLYPSSRAYHVLAQIHEREARDHDAIASYASALDLDPNDAQALFRAGRLWLRLGNAREAVALLERAAEVRPEDPLVRRYLEQAREASKQTGCAPGPPGPGAGSGIPAQHQREAEASHEEQHARLGHPQLLFDRDLEGSEGRQRTDQPRDLDLRGRDVAQAVLAEEARPGCRGRLGERRAPERSEQHDLSRSHAGLEEGLGLGRADREREGRCDPGSEALAREQEGGPEQAGRCAPGDPEDPGERDREADLVDEQGRGTAQAECADAPGEGPCGIAGVHADCGEQEGPDRDLGADRGGLDRREHARRDGEGRHSDSGRDLGLEHTGGRDRDLGEGGDLDAERRVEGQRRRRSRWRESQECQAGSPAGRSCPVSRNRGTHGTSES